jgi:hypothetical protein
MTRMRVISVRRSRWRVWLAWCLLAALAFPSMGTLPWIAEAAAHHHYAAESLAGNAAHHHDGASDVPGSPTHPVDHDCFQCQVLKHLARCVSAVPDAPEIPLPVGCPVQPQAFGETQHAVPAPALPPARGPPLRNA